MALGFCRALAGVLVLEVARQVASEEAGMKLNYKHRKLDGELLGYVQVQGSCLQLVHAIVLLLPFFCFAIIWHHALSPPEQQ
jgi:hypothetical protein